MSPTFWSLLFLLTVSMAVPASAQQRDAVQRGGSGRLLGRVVAADTGQPIARAQITIAREPSGAPHFALTDISGAFDVKNLPDGRYTVRASKPGVYLDTSYGETDFGIPQKVVTVTESEHPSIEVRMLRGAVIAGRVFDEAGDALPLAQVTAARPGAASTKFRAVIAPSAGRFLGVAPGAGAMTNDRGEYRIFGLQPGEYLVYATAPRMRGDSRRYAPVYFPGVIDVIAAARLQVQPGQEIANADFTLRRLPTVSVSGIAVGPDGEPAGGGTLALHVPGAEGDSGLSQVGSIKPDGSFSIDALPGQYILRARLVRPRGSGSRSGWRSLSTATPITIGENDVSGLWLKLTHGAAVSGRFVFEGSGATADPSAFRVVVESGGLGAVQAVQGRPDGTFSLEGIESGSRRIVVIGPPGWVLKGIYLNGRDLADVPVEFTDDAALTDLAVVFTDIRTPLHVMVEYAGSAASCAVIVFAEDPALWQSRRTLFREASSESIVIDGLPAGDYLVAAISDAAVNSLARSDLTLMERLLPLARKVRLAEGMPAAVRVRAVPFPR
jgi:hypothetical protein